MSRYRRAPIPGTTYFFTLNSYRRQVLLTHGEVLTALRSAHRVVRAMHPFRVDAMVVLPDYLHVVWSLPPKDIDYSTLLSLLKRHISQAVRHLLSESQSASRHEAGACPVATALLGTSARYDRAEAPQGCSAE